MNYSNVIQNPHFQQLTGVIRRPATWQKWKKLHPEMPFQFLFRNFDLATAPKDAPLNKSKVLETFTALVQAVTQADPSLSYTAEDMAWFTSVVDLPSSEARAVLGLFKTYATAPEPVERGPGRPRLGGISKLVPVRFDTEEEYALVLDKLNIKERADALVEAARRLL